MTRKNGLLAIAAFWASAFNGEHCTDIECSRGCEQTASAGQPNSRDNMALQRGKANAIWGWTDPGAKVRGDVGNKTATAGRDRRWQAKDSASPYGWPVHSKDHAR